MKILLTVLCLGLGTIATAQNVFDSPYSIYGLGLINNRLSTLNRGMGGTGIAVRDELNLNYVNPASYGSIAAPVNNVFEMGFYVQRNAYRTNELSESKSNGSLTNMNYWFKPKPQWASMIGLTPFSSVSYKINTIRSLGGMSAVDYTYEGSGTISQLYWGNGFNILKNLSVGFNISYLFGSISKSESIDLVNRFSSLIYENRIFTNKINLDAGLQYVFHLKKNKKLIVGVVGDDGITFSASQKNYLFDGFLDTLNASHGAQLRYAIPSSMGLGLSLQSNRSIIAGDLKFQDWSAITADQDVTYQDTWNFSLGYMYKGNPEASDYFGAVSLRAGFHVQNYCIRLKENNLPWWGVTAGISLPMFDNRSSINITYSFDQLGTLKDGLILQRAQQLMIDVVVRDLWGTRRRFE